jgi:Tol biopolymer transport system component
MDYEGHKQEIASSKSALLPAWADDGKRLAYLERTGKNKAVLKIVDVTRPE